MTGLFADILKPQSGAQSLCSDIQLVYAFVQGHTSNRERDMHARVVLLTIHSVRPNAHAEPCSVRRIYHCSLTKVSSRS
ncbi:hypothetical protein BDR04DRAFT_521640 [Suillus decipiens]|nr:hypothetical protein BDR04DRAFT_521640 [Suillus decipiens]